MRMCQRSRRGHIRWRAGCQPSASRLVSGVAMWKTIAVAAKVAMMRNLVMLAATLVATCTAGQRTVGGHAPFESCAFTSNGRTVRCEVVRPSGGGPHPAVILLHGRAGADFYASRLQEQARRLAAKGYVVLTPRYFDATGDDAGPEVSEERFRAWLGAARMAVTHAAGDPAIDARRIGISGLSLGAFMAVTLGQEDRRVRAVASVAGGLSQYASEAATGFPPSVIVHSKGDPVVPVTEAYRLRDAVASAKVPVELHTYDTDAHVLEGAEWRDAMGRIETFFDRHLGQPDRGIWRARQGSNLGPPA